MEGPFRPPATTEARRVPLTWTRTATRVPALGRPLPGTRAQPAAAATADTIGTAPLPVKTRESRPRNRLTRGVGRPSAPSQTRGPHRHLGKDRRPQPASGPGRTPPTGPWPLPRAARCDQPPQNRDRVFRATVPTADRAGSAVRRAHSHSVQPSNGPTECTRAVACPRSRGAPCQQRHGAGSTACSQRPMPIHRRPAGAQGRSVGRAEAADGQSPTSSHPAGRDRWADSHTSHPDEMACHHRFRANAGVRGGFASVAAAFAGLSAAASRVSVATCKPAEGEQWTR